VPRKKLSIVITAWLALSSCALFAWLWHFTQGSLSPLLLAVVLLPAPLGFLSTWTASDRRRLAARATASMLALPVAALFIALGQAEPPSAPHEDATAPQVTSPAEQSAIVDDPRLFEGALAEQAVPMANPGGIDMRSSVFSDGSELTRLRFVSIAAAHEYLAFLVQTQNGRSEVLGGRQGTRLGADPSLEVPFLYVEQHGRDLVRVQAPDATQALARLSNQGLGAPAAAKNDLQPGAGKGAPEAAPTAPKVWPFALGYVLAQVAAFVLFIVWAAKAGTRIDRIPGAARVSSATLRARLLSLNDASLPFRVSETDDGTNELWVDYTFAAGQARAHRVFLALDGGRGEVHVRERLGVSGDAPRDAAEADMRPLGSVGIAPTRPKAQKLYSRTVQATVITSEELAAVQLKLQGECVTLPGDYVAAQNQARNADGMVHVLCTVVIRSGFAWQPMFFRDDP
jgi:hypothetical protein